MAGRPKNLLNVALGAFLQDERKRLSNLSTDEICDKGMLGMSVSLYKMIEAGLASFNINRVPNLIRVYKDSDLIFDRVTKFVSGQNIVDYWISNQDKSPLEAFAELADIDNEFKYLFEHLNQYYDLEGKSQKEFIQTIAINEVKKFLQNTHYPISSQESYENMLITKVKKVPSLSIDLLINFIGSFSHIIPSHFGEVASKWENVNSEKFVQIEGYYSNPELIISEENLATFKYDYLNQKNFKSLRFLFDTEKNIDDLKSIFKKRLNDSRKSINLDPFDDSVFEKVHFKKIHKSQKKFQNDLLRDPLNSNKYLQAFWVFTLKESGSKIAFVGVQENNVGIGYNLSYTDTIVRSNQFESLWEKLN